MKAKKVLILIAIAGMAVVGYFQSQRESTQRQVLEADGFQAALTIDAYPTLVVDPLRREMAAIYPERVVRFTFEQVLAIEPVLRRQDSVEQRPFLRLRLQGAPVATLHLIAPQEPDLDRWERQLRGVMR